MSIQKCIVIYSVPLYCTYFVLVSGECNELVVSTLNQTIEGQAPRGQFPQCLVSNTFLTLCHYHVREIIPPRRRCTSHKRIPGWYQAIDRVNVRFLLAKSRLTP